MATRVKASDAAAKAAAGNGYDGEKLAGYLRKIEGHFDEMESSKASHMNRCRNIRGSIDVVYEEAKALGIPKKVLKAHVDLRLLEKRKDRVVEKLEGEDAETFEMIADALGEFAALPLGQAALKRAAGSDLAADQAALDTLQ